jgi:hypothetical protein
MKFDLNTALELSIAKFTSKLDAAPRPAIVAVPESTEADFARIRAARKRACRVTWAQLTAVSVDMSGIHRRARQLRQFHDSYRAAFADAWREAANAARAGRKPAWDFLPGYMAPSAQSRDEMELEYLENILRQTAFTHERIDLLRARIAAHREVAA